MFGIRPLFRFLFLRGHCERSLNQLGQFLFAVLLLDDRHRFPDPFRGICRGAWLGWHMLGALFQRVRALRARPGGWSFLGGCFADGHGFAHAGQLDRLFGSFFRERHDGFVNLIDHGGRFGCGWLGLLSEPCEQGGEDASLNRRWFGGVAVPGRGKGRGERLCRFREFRKVGDIRRDAR